MDESAAPDANEREHPTGAVRSLLASTIDALRTRLDLVGVEAEIFLLRTIHMLLWALAALACALLALAFSVIAVVAALWDTHRLVGVLGGAAFFVVLAVIFGFVASRAFRSRPRAFEGTLEQLEHDQRRVSGAP